MGRNQLQVQIRLVMFAAVTFAIANSTIAIARPNSKVLAAAKACEPSARSLLQQLVQIDSGTGDVAGLAAMGGILKTELEGLGASVESVNAALVREPATTRAETSPRYVHCVSCSSSITVTMAESRYSSTRMKRPGRWARAISFGQRQRRAMWRSISSAACRPTAY
jgi:hypothetical protein